LTIKKGPPQLKGGPLNLFGYLFGHQFIWAAVSMGKTMRALTRMTMLIMKETNDG
jgi:hypothetical protein